MTSPDTRSDLESAAALLLGDEQLIMVGLQLFKRTSQASQDHNGAIAGAALDLADIGPVDPCLQGQIL